MVGIKSFPFYFALFLAFFHSYVVAQTPNRIEVDTAKSRATAGPRTPNVSTTKTSRKLNDVSTASGIKGADTPNALREGTATTTLAENTSTASIGPTAEVTSTAPESTTRPRLPGTTTQISVGTATTAATHPGSGPASDLEPSGTQPRNTSRGPKQLDTVYPEVRKSKCRRRCLRKEWSKTNTTERKRFTDAMFALTKSPGKLKSLFADMAQIHKLNEVEAHEVLKFHPWHRYFLSMYERTLQEIDETVCLFYWEPQVIEGRPFYHDPAFVEIYGVPSGPGVLEHILNGPFAGFSPYGSDELLKRQFINKTLASPEFVYTLMRESKSYENFTRAYSVLVHANPHEFTGGPMATMLSPLDPMFLGHHCNVDRMFEAYSQHYPNSDHPQPNLHIPIANTRVEDLLDAENLCFVYDRLLPPANYTPPSKPPPPPSQVSLKTAKMFDRKFEDEKDRFDNISATVNLVVDTNITNILETIPELKPLRKKRSTGSSFASALSVSVLTLFIPLLVFLWGNL